LAEIFDPARAAVCFLGRADYQRQVQQFPFFNCHQSLAWLRAFLERARPRLIYLCTGWFNHFLGLAVRRIVPRARFIHEVFDWNALFPDHSASEMNGLDRRTRNWNLLGEYEATQRADLIISKRDGPLWETFRRHFRCCYQAYFNGARLCETKPSNIERKPTRMVYGGILPDPQFLARFTSDYQFLALFEALVEAGDLTIDIFNALDDGSDPDRFRAYREKYTGGPIRYHAALPYHQFLERAVDFDYGWLATPTRGHLDPDQGCVMPSRLVGYLAAGLPVISDDVWALPAALIRRFDAGVVLRRVDAGSVRQALATADRQSHRAGARRLAEHLVAHNRTTLAELKKMWCG
jgi:hypothetical protein